MSNNSIGKVLLVEDSTGDARLLREMFADRSPNYVDLIHVQCMSEAEEYLAAHGVDIILLDLGLPDAQGLGAIRRIRAAAPHTALVVLTGLEDESLAALALQEGVQDYLVKGQIETRALRRALRYAVERKIMEERLFAEQERAQVTLNSIGDAVISTDSDGSVTFLNLAAEAMTGWSQQEAVGRPLADVYRPRDAEILEITPDSMDAATARVHLTSSGTLLRRDGTEIPIEDSAAPIHDRDGRSSGAVVVFRDVSARALAQQMTHSAQHDYLTGLPNRMLLRDRIGQAIAVAPRHENRIALLFLDLDGFKQINDSLGHLTGDRLLQSVAGRLVDCVRGSDTVSRQGGDEFVVLLSEVNEADDASLLARRILRSVAQPHTLGGHDLHVSISIGISIYPDDGLDAETLIKHADIAMYQAKKQGRQGYQFFLPATNVRAVERHSIEDSLRRAIERQEFALHYQPKICVRTGRIRGAEALIRWTHPVRGPVCPSHFLPIAEDCGLIQPIGTWILREACRQARAWVDAGLPTTTVAVNVCAGQFENQDFAKDLFDILAESRLDPRSLELEVTEGLLMKHGDSAAAILQDVRKGGVRVVVDEFGSGYSSFSYFQNHPVDALKMDRSFVSQLTEAGREASIVAAMTGMARSLELRVAADGVETAAQLAVLQAHLCDEVQGNFIGPPLPALQFAELLRARQSEPAIAAAGTSPNPWPSNATAAENQTCLPQETQ